MGTSDSMAVFQIIICLIIAGSEVWAANTAYMKTTIENNFAAARHHTATADQTKKQEARNFIYSEFTRFNLHTYNDSFTNPSYSGVTFVNMIGVIKGTNFGTTSDKLMGIGAHYDTVAGSNGVDDNGSGVAAMLEAISQLVSASNTNYPYTIVFVAFDAEELAMLGSEQFVGQWFPSFLVQNYGAANAATIFRTGAMILDCVMEYDTAANAQGLPSGFQTAFPTAYQSISSDTAKGDFITMIYREANTEDSAMATSFKAAWDELGNTQYEIETVPLPTTDNAVLASTYSEYMRSDHKKLWAGDYPALFLTDTADYRGSMKTCYHQSCDNTATILTDTNVAFLGKVADAVTKTIIKLEGIGSSARATFHSTSTFMAGVVAVIVTVWSWTDNSYRAVSV